MNRILFLTGLAFFCFSISPLLLACDDLNGSSNDYARLDRIRQATQGKVFGATLTPIWISDELFIYRNESAGGIRRFQIVDSRTGEQQTAFNHEALAMKLATAAARKVDADKLPFTAIFYADLDNRQEFSFVAFGDTWTFNTDSQHLAKKDGPLSITPTRNYQIQSSVSLGGRTKVKFVNRRDDPILIDWLDLRSRRRRYGEVKPDGVFETSTYVGHRWLVRDSDRRTLTVVQSLCNQEFTITDELVPQRRISKPTRPSTVSPDGTKRIAARDFNLSLRTSGKDEDWQRLTKDGVEKNSYTGPFRWSPDSKYVVAFRRSQGDRRQVHLLGLQPGDLTSRHQVMTYVKPGDKIDQSFPVLFRAKDGAQVEIDQSLLKNPWSIADVEWKSDSKAFSFVFNQRGHQKLRVVEVDAATGSSRALIDEKSDTFIHYSGKYFFQRVPTTSEMIWMSERSGWNHLYLYDSEKGQVKNAITSGEWVVRGVDRVDVENRRIYFRAGGFYPDQDPYLVHFGHVDFDGSNLVMMTKGDGNHAIQYSPDGKYFIDTYSRVDLPPIHELRRTSDGKLICELQRSDIDSLLATGWKKPIPFQAKGRDGVTDIFGVVYQPQNMDPDRKYPVVEYIYAGPQDSFVPKSFFVNRQEKLLTELGFVVVQIDGMGTSNRSKKFHDVCWKNLGDSGFPDRIAWLKAAAKEFPQIDLERVGIYGGSAGGQSALRAVLAHGDFYDVAVADCGCHDNRMDKIWWNEQWMGWPIGDHYAEQSNVTNAKKLTGKLFLIVGATDRNVDPASTMQVVNALIKADKDFDLLVVPNGGHGIGSGKYGMRRTRDFLVRHLIGKEPRHTSKR